jgi:hypothetical protein
MRNLLRNSAVCLALASGAIMFAQGTVVNIGTRHGNLQAAQQYIVAAFQRIDDAQRANHGQLGGHAQRAKDLLAQADEELRLAADVANER